MDVKEITKRIFFAIVMGKEETLMKYIKISKERGILEKVINTREFRNKSLALHAFETGNIHFIDILVKNGFNLATKSPYFLPVLLEAKVSEHIELYNYLLKFPGTKTRKDFYGGKIDI